MAELKGCRRKDRQCDFVYEFENHSFTEERESSKQQRDTRILSKIEFDSKILNLLVLRGK